MRVPMNAAERAQFEKLRGREGAAAYARRILLAWDLGLDEGTPPAPRIEAQRPESEVTPAPAPVRSTLRIPPPNVPDAEGLLYHWEWKGKRWGTLTLTPSRPGQAGAYAVDLGDAELEAHSDGSSVITYKDRTEMRTTEGE